MTSINLNPATRIGSTPQTPQPRRPAPQDLEERLLIARLFGKPLPDAGTAQPAQSPAKSENDEFAPNLGRHLDVLL